MKVWAVRTYLEFLEHVVNAQGQTIFIAKISLLQVVGVIFFIFPYLAEWWNSLGNAMKSVNQMCPRNFIHLGDSWIFDFLSPLNYFFTSREMVWDGLMLSSELK